MEDEAAKLEKEKAKEKKISDLAEKTNTTAEAVKDSITNKKEPGRQDDKNRFDTQSDRD